MLYNVENDELTNSLTANDELISVIYWEVFVTLYDCEVLVSISGITSTPFLIIEIMVSNLSPIVFLVSSVTADVLYCSTSLTLIDSLTLSIKSYDDVAALPLSIISKTIS